MTCEHKEFNATVAVGRLSKDEGGPVTHYTAGVKIHCVDCGKPFEFVGLPVGHSSYRPMTSFDALELRAPIMPEGERPPEGLAGYVINQAPDGEQ